MIAEPDAAPPARELEGGIEALLAALRLPQDLSETEATLIKLGQLLSPESSGWPDLDCAVELVLTLITKLRFYILVLTAQNFLIRDMRAQLKESVAGIGR